MNGTLKALLKIDVSNLVIMVFSGLLAMGLLTLIRQPTHPIAIFIGAFIGTRIGNVVEYRASLKGTDTES